MRSGRAPGFVLIAAVGWFWFKQSLDIAAIVGLSLIVAGVSHRQSLLQLGRALAASFCGPVARQPMHFPRNLRVESLTGGQK